LRDTLDFLNDDRHLTDKGIAEPEVLRKEIEAIEQDLEAVTGKSTGPTRHSPSIGPGTLRGISALRVPRSVRVGNSAILRSCPGLQGSPTHRGAEDIVLDAPAKWAYRGVRDAIPTPGLRSIGEY
jgi:hypothetical protein